VFLDLKDCTGDTWEECIVKFGNRFVFMRHSEEIYSEIEKGNRIDFENPTAYEDKRR
jgi:hypothetical protein